MSMHSKASISKPHQHCGVVQVWHSASNISSSPSQKDGTQYPWTVLYLGGGPAPSQPQSKSDGKHQAAVLSLWLGLARGWPAIKVKHSPRIQCSTSQELSPGQAAQNQGYVLLLSTTLKATLCSSAMRLTNWSLRVHAHPPLETTALAKGACLSGHHCTIRCMSVWPPLHYNCYRPRVAQHIHVHEKAWVCPLNQFCFRLLHMYLYKHTTAIQWNPMGPIICRVYQGVVRGYFV